MPVKTTTKDAVEILKARYITDDARKQSVEHEREIAAKDAEIARLMGEVERLEKSCVKCETCSLNLSLAAAHKVIKAREEELKDLAAWLAKADKRNDRLNGVIEDVRALARDDSFNAWQQMHKIQQLLPEDK